MKKYISIIATLVCIIAFRPDNLKAQAKLSVTHVSFQNDTTTFNTANPLSFTIANTGNQAYSGKLYIYFKNTDSLVMKSPQILDSINLVNLSSGDSTNIHQPNFSITQNNFKNYSNIIVIWPLVSDTSGTSASVSVYVRESIAGIIENHISENDFIIYPNPVNSLIYIKALDSKNKVESVRIYNCIGTLVNIINQNLTTVDLSYLSQGLYILEIETNNNRRIIKRIFRNSY